MNRALPYAFKGLTAMQSLGHFRVYNLVPRQLVQTNLGSEIFTQFSEVFTNVLQAMQERDEEFLRNIMEPKLFRATNKCLGILKAQNANLHYLENKLEQGENDITQENDEDLSAISARLKLSNQNVENFPFQYKSKDMNIHLEFKGVFGLRINRQENKGVYLKIPGYKEAGRLWYFDLYNPFNVYNNQILVLNVTFKTTRRLIATADQETDTTLVYGDQDLKVFHYHKWRFETYIPNIDWVLTDMDEYLDGNAYY